MCVFFSPFVLFLFPLSPLPGVQPGSISLFCPIFDAMFSRYDIIPPPHASTVEAGVFCCGLGFGGVFDPSASDLGVTLSSSWIPLEFAKGSSPYFTDLFFFFFSFLLYDSIPSVTRCQKCTNLAGCLLLEMVKATLGFSCIHSNILSPWNQLLDSCFQGYLVEPHAWLAWTYHRYLFAFLFAFCSDDECVPSGQ